MRIGAQISTFERNLSAVVGAKAALSLLSRSSSIRSSNTAFARIVEHRNSDQTNNARDFLVGRLSAGQSVSDTKSSVQ